jgi:hypothetical protein
MVGPGHRRRDRLADRIAVIHGPLAGSARRPVRCRTADSPSLVSFDQLF